MILTTVLSILVSLSPPDSTVAFDQNRWLLGVGVTMNRLEALPGSSAETRVPIRPSLGVLAGHQWSVNKNYISTGLTFNVRIYEGGLPGNLMTRYYDGNSISTFVMRRFNPRKYEPGVFVNAGRWFPVRDSTALCIEAGIAPYYFAGQINPGELNFGIGVYRLIRRIQLSVVPSIRYDLSPSWRYGMTATLTGQNAVVERHPLRGQLTFTWGL